MSWSIGKVLLEFFGDIGNPGSHVGWGICISFFEQAVHHTGFIGDHVDEENTSLDVAG